MEQSNVRDRIRKMLAMGMDGRGNEHEAENAMRMAEKLMRLHNIDIAELQESTGKAAQYTWTTVTAAIGENGTRKTTKNLWTGFLGMGIARFTDCKATWRNNQTQGWLMAFSGTTTDTEYALWLFEYLRDIGYRESRGVAGAYRRTFLNAYALRLQGRTSELRIARNEAMATEVYKSGGTALALVNTKLAQRDVEFGRQGTGRTARVNFASNGYMQGRAAADKVQFNKPLAGAVRKKIGG
jgi:hypothetical protein